MIDPKLTIVVTLLMFATGITNIVAEQPKAKTTIITGFIPDTKDETAEIRIDIFTTQYPQTSESISTKTVNGHFKLVFKIAKEKFIRINKDGKVYLTNLLLFKPADSIHLDFKSKGDEKNIYLAEQRNISQVNFSGRGYYRLLLMQDILNATKPDIKAKPIYKQTIAEQTQALENNTNTAIAVAKNYTGLVDSESLDFVANKTIASYYHTYFMVFLRNDLQADSIANLFQAKVANSPYIGRAMPNAIATKMSDVALMERAILFHCMDRKIVYDEALYKKDLPLTYFILKKAYQKYSNGNQLLEQFIVSKLKSNKLADTSIKTCVADFLVHNDKTSESHRRVAAAWENYQFISSKGTPAYAFALPDASGKIHELANYEGKVVLLDFMFNGCVGCKLMVPALTEIEKQFRADDKISFISISIDKSLAVFKDAIGKYTPVGGIHLYTGGAGNKHPVIEKNMVSTYPTLMLIDQQGKIVTPKAPDPRTSEGKAQLVALIKNTINAQP